MRSAAESSKEEKAQRKKDAAEAREQEAFSKSLRKERANTQRDAQKARHAYAYASNGSPTLPDTGSRQAKRASLGALSQT